jgi:hypothetical protein
MIIKGKHLSALRHCVNHAEAGLQDGDEHEGFHREIQHLQDEFRDRPLPRGAVLLSATPAEVRALIKALDNSLTDPDFRKDHMTKREREFADRLAGRLERSLLT